MSVEAFFEREWPELVVFDLETTGLSPERDAIVEIGALRLRGQGLSGRHWEEAGRYSALVRPTTAAGDPRPIPWQAQRVHGISDEMVREAPTIGEVLPAFLDFVGDAAVVAHNISFDSGFLRANAARHGLRWAPPAELCTVQLSRRTFPPERSHQLGAVAERRGLSFAPGRRHRSLGDVEVTAQAYVRLSELLRGGR